MLQKIAKQANIEVVSNKTNSKMSTTQSAEVKIQLELIIDPPQRNWYSFTFNFLYNATIQG